MRNNAMRTAACCLILSLALTTYSQTPLTLSGTVRQSLTKDRVPAVSVIIKGTSVGTFTDDHGNFKLVVVQQPPFTLVFSSIGFEAQEVNVTSMSAPVMVDFAPASTLGKEVVVSATRGGHPQPGIARIHRKDRRYRCAPGPGGFLL